MKDSGTKYTHGASTSTVHFQSYDVSFEMKKNFTPTEITDMQHAFKLYDTDKNCTMNAQEFKQVLIDLGKRDVTDDQVKKMLADVDKNGDSVI